MNAQDPERRGRWFETYRKLALVSTKSERTLSTELTSQGKFWAYLDSIGETRDELSVTRDHILGYIHHLKDCDLSNSYQIKLLVNLSSFYKQAVKQGWISINPMEEIEFPQKIEEVPTVLTVKEMKSLLKAPALNKVDELRDRVMMEVSYSCGLRRHEVTGLKVDQIMENYQMIRIQGKGGREAVLPLTRVASHFLSFYMKKLYPRLNRKNVHEAFLSVMTRLPMQPRHMNTIVKKYALRAKIKKHISSHIFRHSIATHLGAEGVDVRYIQEFLRHESLNSTMRYIQHGFKQLRETHRKTHPKGGE